MMQYNNPPENARRRLSHSVYEIASTISRQLRLDSQFAALESSQLLVRIVDLVNEISAWEQVLQREDFVLDTYLCNYPGVSLHIRPPGFKNNQETSLSDCNEKLEQMLLELEPQGEI